MATGSAILNGIRIGVVDNRPFHYKCESGRAVADWDSAPKGTHTLLNRPILIEYPLSEEAKAQLIYILQNTSADTGKKRIALEDFRQHDANFAYVVEVMADGNV